MNKKKTKLIFIWFSTGSVAGNGLQGVLPTKEEAHSVDYRLD